MTSRTHKGQTPQGKATRIAFVGEMVKRGLEGMSLLEKYNETFGTHYPSISSPMTPAYLRNAVNPNGVIQDEMFFSQPGIGMDDRNQRIPRCVICKGKFPLASASSWGIKPDRKGFPKVFICWECVHWLYGEFSAQIENFSYMMLFSERNPQVKASHLANKFIQPHWKLYP